MDIEIKAHISRATVISTFDPKGKNLIASATCTGKYPGAPNITALFFMAQAPQASAVECLLKINSNNGVNISGAGRAGKECIPTHRAAVAFAVAAGRAGVKLDDWVLTHTIDDTLRAIGRALGIPDNQIVITWEGPKP